MRVGLVLRGHIRETFKYVDLYNFVKTLVDKYDVDIYCHTWNVFSNALSYRPVSENRSSVTEDTIYDYFADLKPSIKHIIIDNDADAILIGDTERKLCKSTAPKRGWKYYWYGQLRIFKYIQETGIQYDFLINTRFDIIEFDRYRVYKSNMVVNYTEEKLLGTELYNRIEEVFDKGIGTKNYLYYDTWAMGIDNFMIGNVDTMLNLINRFHFHLDEICDAHPFSVWQEWLVYYENERL
jgi:hypothetical protein